MGGVQASPYGETEEMNTKTIATLLGEDEKKIRTLSVDWLTLMKEGVIVEVHFHRWRGKGVLSLDDLGIKADDEEQRTLDDLVSLGEKKLMPPEVIRKLSSIDSSGRQWLERCSFGTKWGRFVPATKYAEWKAKNEELQTQYFETAAEYIRNFETHKSGLIQQYRVTAGAAYKRLKALDPQALKGISEPVFVQKFMDGIVAMIPSKEKIEASFGYEVDLSYIPLPSLIAEDEERAANVRSRSNRTAEQVRQLDRLNAEVLEKARKDKTELVDGFIADLTRQLRGLVYNATTDVLASIQNNKQLHPRSVIQLRNLVETVKGMNFFGDRETDVMLARVQSAISTKVDDRSIEAIEQSLREIATVTRASLIALGDEPRSARALGVANVPAENVVRTARRSLGLDVASIESVPATSRGRRSDAAAVSAIAA